MPKTPIVEIALGVYNGENYLADFLDSLETQDFEDWRLLIRDDRSSDGTQSIIDNWISRFPGRCNLASDSGSQNLGLAGNFSRLLSETTLPYVMLADHDDIWFQYKVSATLEKMKVAEATFGTETPLLVHTDLEVVDQNLDRIAASAWEYYDMNPAKTAGNFGMQIIQPTAFSPTFMLNRALIDLVLDIPSQLKQQDAWISMIASAFGKVLALEQQTLFYRRHSKNDSLGDLRGIRQEIFRALKSLPRMHDHLHMLLAKEFPRNVAFLNRFRHELKAEQIRAIETFLALRHLPWPGRKLALARNGLWYSSAARSLGMLLLI
jgi:glycosyltransferase involved in cell wall biosynthesis